MVPKPAIDAKAPPSGANDPEHIITAVTDPTKTSQEPGLLHRHDQDTDTSDALTASNPSMRRKSSASIASDSESWLHLSVDHGGATLRTVCSHQHEEGQDCSHAESNAKTERRYRNFPRVDEPAKKITIQGVRDMEARDMGGVVERDGEEEDGEEGWVVLERG